jgi:hypothetical protein
VFTETRQALHSMWAVPCITNTRYPRAMWTLVTPINLDGLGSGSSPELPASGQVTTRELEPEEEAFGNWVPTSTVLSLGKV